MSEIILQSDAITPQPLPRVNVTIRPGVMGDVPFLDSLQKLHTKQVGWMPAKQFEGKIKAGHVLVAEVVSGGSEVVSDNCRPTTHDVRPMPAGYLIGNDQYFKRDDVGIIYQMNVMPGRQRGLIGASLLKAQFERSAYGCKLYCCWCAQDIAANHFWEAMGFVPLAFRAGSEKKSRIHIFWQKRIRQGDVTTPWWFPSQTPGGSIREDRIVLPIPPGTHWSDAKPLVLPGRELQSGGEPKKLPEKKSHGRDARVTKTASQPIPPVGLGSGGLRFAQIVPVEMESSQEKTKREKKKIKIHRVRQKNDPRLVAAARELRDRWLEDVNAGRAALPMSAGKYDVGRTMEVGQATCARLLASQPRLLAAALAGDDRLLGGRSRACRIFP